MSAWSVLEVWQLKLLLEDCQEDAPIHFVVKFPDIDFAVEGWGIELVDTPTGPEIVTSVYEPSFDYPSVARKLKKVADRLVYYNSVDWSAD